MNNCQSCRAELPSDARFCTICGTIQVSQDKTAAPSSRHANTPTKQELSQIPEIEQKLLEDAQTIPLESLPPPTQVIQPVVKHTTTPPKRTASPLPKRPTSSSRPSLAVVPQRPGLAGPTNNAQPLPLTSTQSETRASSLQERVLINSTPPGSSASIRPEQPDETDTPAPLPIPDTPPALKTLDRPMLVAKTHPESFSKTGLPMLSEPQVPRHPVRSNVPPTQEVHPDSEQSTRPELDSRFPEAPHTPQASQVQKHMPATQGQTIQDAKSSRGSTPNLDTLSAAYRPARAGSEPFKLTVTRSDFPTMSNVNSERFVATSQAAERWRESWRDRQHAEAGPAEKASRGQASVPMPLLAMQQSFMRMRALNNLAQQDGRNAHFGFWVTLFLMLCLIGGMSIYIFSSYWQSSRSGTVRTSQTTLDAQPSLSIQGTQPATLTVGQRLPLHGDHFSPNDSIALLLDTTTPITGTDGKSLTAQTNSNGTFAVTVLIGTGWTAGSHLLEALSNHTSQAAYLTVAVMPAGTPVRSSANLQISEHQLTFTATIGMGNPAQQRVTVTNTSNAPLKWIALAFADHNLNWLTLNDHETQGTLAISQTHSIGISVITTGLQSSTKPYTGQILFSLNDKELLTLPVQLQMKDAKPELTFSPNPIIVISRPDGSCQPGASLTLLNLGTGVQNWKLGMDSNTGNRLHFLLNGQIATSGQLAPSGQSNGTLTDTQVLQVQCFGVKPGDTYPITVYANGASWPELVTIQ